MRSVDNNYKKVTDPADPRRCQSNDQNGQCRLQAIEGSKYCFAHGGAVQEYYKEKEKVRNYRLNQWKQRINELAETPEIKSIREEVAIMRMIVESKLNSCKSETDLLTMSAPIADSVMKVKELVQSCHKLESAIGELFDRQQLLRFTSEIVEIISTELADQPEKVQAINSRILLSMEQMKTEELE